MCCRSRPAGGATVEAAILHTDTHTHTHSDVSVPGSEPWHQLAGRGPVSSGRFDTGLQRQDGREGGQTRRHG